MPYNEEFDSRLARVLPREAARKKMFGGTCYTIKGNMVCGVYKDFLILRLGERQAADALKLPGVKPMDITGKPMKGWVMVSEEGYAGDRDLLEWVRKGTDFARSLPLKIK